MVVTSLCQCSNMLNDTWLYQWNNTLTDIQPKFRDYSGEPKTNLIAIPKCFLTELIQTKYTYIATDQSLWKKVYRKFFYMELTT